MLESESERAMREGAWNVGESAVVFRSRANAPGVATGMSNPMRNETHLVFTKE